MDRTVNQDLNTSRPKKQISVSELAKYDIFLPGDPRLKRIFNSINLKT